MKVSELIAELQKAPQDVEVSTQGCDCDGDVSRVEVRTQQDWETKQQVTDVYLRRC